MNFNIARWAVAALLIAGGTTNVRADDQSDEYRLTVFPTYALTEDKRWIGIGYVGYVENPEDDYQISYLGLGTIRRLENWGEIWTVLLNVRTDNQDAPDINEYRPVLGFKNYFTRSHSFTFYNLARMEYRIQERDQPGNDTEYFRFRDRLGVEFALGQTETTPGSWYALADAELFYRFDRDMSDLARLRGGLGYVFNEYVRLELIYHMQFSRSAGDSFEWTENIYRLNVKVSRHKGVLSRLGVGHMED